MRIINPQWTNLAKGYQSARNFEQQALKNWNTTWAKSVEFARQQGLKRAVELIQAQIKNERRTLRIVLMLLGGVVALMALLNWLAGAYPALRWFLLPVGVINFIQALILLLPIVEKLLAISKLKSLKPPPEEEPQIELEITAQWWQAVSSQEALESAEAAEAGQVAFLKYLSENLPDDYFAVRHPLLQKALHVEVLLLGPTGIWLFEVKHWRGRALCRNGVWSREPAPGERIDNTTPRFDQHWLGGRETVEKTLSQRLARNASFGALIRGGLVFTHPQIQIEVDGSSKVQYGAPPQWLQRIQATAGMAQFSTEIQLLVLDALLDYALSVSGARPLVKSAVDLAKALYGDLLEELRRYVLRQVRSRLTEKG